MEPAATDAVKTGLTMANCVKHIRDNRLEYLVASLLLYSVGALDKGMQYAGQCL
jgi:hypothetical protein